MYASDILHSLRCQQLVAVIRGDSKENGIQVSKACIEGGLTAIEMAYTNRYASEIISALNDEYADCQDVHIGAGTVLDAPTARMAILAGAKYVVSPAFDHETAVMCHRYGVPYIPGCMTLKEIITAMEDGCEMIKLFPGSVLGKGMISAVKGPLPQASFMVTGGVNMDNMNEWFEAGADCLGIGGELNRLGAKEEYQAITKKAKAYVQNKKA